MTSKEQILSEWEFQRQKWALSSWKISFSHTKRTLGHCNCRNKIISISNPYMKANPFSVMKETLLHEIAHALQFEKTGKTNHGTEWKKFALSVGCKPLRCADSSEIKLPSAKYVGICPGCRNKTNFYRKVRKQYSCKICSNKYDPKYKLKIVEVNN